MDFLNELEIYIPSEAEVKHVLMASLPRSLWKRIHLQSDNSRKDESAKGIWICPVKLQKKGWRTGTNETGNMSSQLVSKIRSIQGPLQMPFVTANYAAYRVLKDTVPGKHSPHFYKSPRGTRTRVYQEAVVIYGGNIYLVIRNPNHGQKSKRVSKSDHSSTSPPEEEKVHPCVNSNTTLTARHDTQAHLSSVHQEDGHCRPGDETFREAHHKPAAPPHPQREQVVVAISDSEDDQDPHRGEAESMELTHSETGGGALWRQSGAAAATPTSLVHMCDFEALETEEMIAQMKAKLQKNAAAVDKLPSS